MVRIRVLLFNFTRAIAPNQIISRTLANKPRQKSALPQFSLTSKGTRDGSMRKINSIQNVLSNVANRLKFTFIAKFFTASTKPLIMLPVEMSCECPKPDYSDSREKQLPNINPQEVEEVELFQEYLRIPTVHPNPNYTSCIKFLLRQARRLDLPMKVFYPVNKMNPLIVLTWEGTDPSLPAILLNSHMDVVPVTEKNWTHPPFGAEIDADGKIFARGAQDMKSVGMQYLAAIHALKAEGHKCKRTIHIAFVPDEELGGRMGMRPFVHTEDFKALKVGFCLDEGMASPTDVFPVFYCERAVWHVHFRISGTSGHGSLLLNDTAGEKLWYILNQMMDCRAIEVQRLKNNPHLTIGDVTTINFTRLYGGSQTNTLPHRMYMSFDVRFAIDADQQAFEENISRWCAEAGGDIELAYEIKRPHAVATVIDSSNPYWVQFNSAMDELGIKTKPLIMPGGTDARYLREIGIPAIGFSPMGNTPILCHDNDEYIRVDTYLRGIEIYKKLIAKIANT